MAAAARSPRVRLDPFVAAVRKDPGDTSPLCVLTGFVGRSPDKGKLRIYPDAGLSRWIEAAEADVVHSEPIADSPLGGSHLWLKGSAELSSGGAGPAGANGGWPPTLGCMGHAAPAAQAWLTHQICAARMAATDPVFTDAFGCRTQRPPCASAEAAAAINVTGRDPCPWPSHFQACSTRPCITIYAPCLPYTIGGCYVQAAQAFGPTHSANCGQTVGPWNC